MKNKSSINVTVLLQRVKVLNNLWISEKWQLLGVVPIVEIGQTLAKTVPVDNQNNEHVYRYDNFKLHFEYDELDSYYQNLISDNACIFVVCHQDNNDNPKPFLVTLSYDEAAIYMETDEVVFTTGININIYQQIEKFVLQNYYPEKKKKRKLTMGSAGDHYKVGSVYE